MTALRTDVSRRQFLNRSARNAAGLAAGLVGLTGAAAPRPVHIGIIGVGRQGLRLAETFGTLPGVVVGAICDCDPAALRRAAGRLTRLQSPVLQFSDAAEFLNRGQLDAVVVATPDNTHLALAQHVLAAEKDLYLESPACYSPGDGLQLIAAAEASKQVVQSGLFDRSLEHVVSAIECVHSGRLGRVPLAKAWAVHRRRKHRDQGIDGPSDADWRQNWATGSGVIGDWVGLLDVARWGLNVTLPQRVSAAGARLVDTGETPDSLQATMTFPSAVLQWEHREWSNHTPEGRSAGVAFHGERGTLIVDRGGWKLYDSDETLASAGRSDLTPHVALFVDRVRRRQFEGDLNDAVYSASLAQLINCSYRLGREIRFDAQTAACVGDSAAAKLCGLRS